jgi:hypothetical protein
VRREKEREIVREGEGDRDSCSHRKGASVCGLISKKINTGRRMFDSHHGW